MPRYMPMMAAKQSPKKLSIDTRRLKESDWQVLFLAGDAATSASSARTYLLHTTAASIRGLALAAVRQQLAIRNALKVARQQEAHSSVAVFTKTEAYHAGGSHRGARTLDAVLICVERISDNAQAIRCKAEPPAGSWRLGKLAFCAGFGILSSGVSIIRRNCASSGSARAREWLSGRVCGTPALKYCGHVSEPGLHLCRHLGSGCQVATAGKRTIKAKYKSGNSNSRLSALVAAGHRDMAQLVDESGAVPGKQDSHGEKQQQPEDPNGQGSIADGSGQAVGGGAGDAAADDLVRVIMGCGVKLARAVLLIFTLIFPAHRARAAGRGDLDAGQPDRLFNVLNLINEHAGNSEIGDELERISQQKGVVATAGAILVAAGAISAVISFFGCMGASSSPSSCSSLHHRPSAGAARSLPRVSLASSQLLILQDKYLISINEFPTAVKQPRESSAVSLAFNSMFVSCPPPAAPLVDHARTPPQLLVELRWDFLPEMLRSFSCPVSGDGMKTLPCVEAHFWHSSINILCGFSVAALPSRQLSCW
uniref:Multidrug and toxic compound extrusion protein n=1 Tax=Macrostomum lignano TaxID=282301 RepID=A0A1I8F9N2_9PLAT